MVKELIYIPLIHDPYKSEIFERYKDRLNQVSPVVKRVFLEEQELYWNNIDRFLENRNINRIYHDSYCSEYHDEVINKIYNPKYNESRNFKILRKLLKKGSILTKTESKEKIDEYLKGDVYNPKIRDDYIIKSINETLNENETGVLIMGAAHNVHKYFENENSKIKLTRAVNNINSLVLATLNLFKEVDVEDIIDFEILCNKLLV